MEKSCETITRKFDKCERHVLLFRLTVCRGCTCGMALNSSSGCSPLYSARGTKLSWVERSSIMVGIGWNWTLVHCTLIAGLHGQEWACRLPALILLSVYMDSSVCRGQGCACRLPALLLLSVYMDSSVCRGQGWACRLPALLLLSVYMLQRSGRGRAGSSVTHD